MKNATEKPEILETSMEILEKLSYYLSFSFVRYALIVGILVSLCASLLGTILVLRRYSLIGDGLSHAALGAFSSFLGIMISIVLSTPVGATIVIIDIMIFALHCVAGRFL